MDVKISESWKKYLEGEFDKPYFKDLIAFVKQEYSTKKIHPPRPFIFRAFDECSFEDCRVVILGQDPYHSPNTANGLSFSVNPENKIPPSLQNIYKEMKSDLALEPPINGDLTNWAKQGVLLLNSVLTVEQGKPGSHAKKGWETFTDAVIKTISDKKNHVVFFLWGAYAQKKGEIIDRSKHLVIESAHPSPFSVLRGFYGNRPFSKTNAYLKLNKEKEINWANKYE
ncbi:MAG: uracil-DNA glycosylase [Candidatus Dojkabacteria bacterium]